LIGFRKDGQHCHAKAAISEDFILFKISYWASGIIRFLFFEQIDH
jgi:hypothetical protein